MVVEKVLKVVRSAWDVVLDMRNLVLLCMVDSNGRPERCAREAVIGKALSSSSTVIVCSSMHVR